MARERRALWCVLGCLVSWGGSSGSAPDDTWNRRGATPDGGAAPGGVGGWSASTVVGLACQSPGSMGQSSLGSLSHPVGL